MDEELGYRCLHHLFKNIEYTHGIRIYGDADLFERIKIPEGNVEKIFPVALFSRKNL